MPKTSFKSNKNLTSQDWSDEDFCDTSGLAGYSTAHRRTTPHAREKRKRSRSAANCSTETRSASGAGHTSAEVNQHEPRENTETKRSSSAKVARRNTRSDIGISKITTSKTLRDYFQPASTPFKSQNADAASCGSGSSSTTQEKTEPRKSDASLIALHGSSSDYTKENKSLEVSELDERLGPFAEEYNSSELQYLAPVHVLEDSDRDVSDELHRYGLEESFDIKMGSEPASSCPVCGFSMAEMALSGRESHVNKCLDGSGDGISGATTPNSSTPPSVTPPLPVQKETVFQKFCNAFSFGKRGFDVSKEASPPNEEVPSKKSQSGKPSNGQKGSLWKKGSNRTCPWYKRMPGTSFVVDAFSFGNIPPPASSDIPTAYFLSHYHADHYGGLRSSFSHGLIYCSAITGNLVAQQLKVDEKFVRRLPMNEQVTIDGVGVTLLEANHCPGSVIFLFSIPKKDGSVHRLLHTGDFRAHPSMTTHPAILQPQNPPIDILYLDTTYCNPKYCFPPQLQVVEAVADLCQALYMGNPADLRIDLSGEKSMMNAWLSKGDIHSGKSESLEVKSMMNDGTSKVDNNNEKAQPLAETPLRSDNLDSVQEGRTCTTRRILFVVGSYTIGKERVFLAIAKAIGSKIYVPEWKRKVIACLDDDEASAILTTDPELAMVHVVPLGHINPEGMMEYLSKYKAFFSEIHAFRPTGWTFSTKPPQTSKFTASSIRSSFRSPPITIYGLPYSEHSSFQELASFAMSLDIHKIVPTVNMGSATSRQAMQIHFDRWNAEKRRKGGRIAWIGN